MFSDFQHMPHRDLWKANSSFCVKQTKFSVTWKSLYFFVMFRTHSTGVAFLLESFRIRSLALVWLCPSWVLFVQERYYCMWGEKCPGRFQTSLFQAQPGGGHHGPCPHSIGQSSSLGHSLLQGSWRSRAPHWGPGRKGRLCLETCLETCLPNN